MSANGNETEHENSLLNIGNVRSGEPVVPSSSGLLPEFNDAVSPWNVGDSSRMSDDVAQLLVSGRLLY